MMKRLFAILSLAVALTTLTTTAAFSQKPQNKKPTTQDDQVGKIGTTIVRLPITVKNKNQILGGLLKSDFEVYEDGKKQHIDDFKSPSQLPLNVGLLMDTSNSVKLKLPFEKDSAEDFVATVTTYRRKDQVLFATFDSDVELHQDFTDSLETLSKSIRKVKAGGYTKMYDAVYRVIEEKMATTPNSEARRIIVILSDGEDTASEHTLKDTIEIAQRYDVTIFGISTKNFTGTGAGTVENSDDKDLRNLCEETGGQVFLPSQKVELFRAFSQVAQDLRQEYVIYYTPINQEKTGKHRDIKVKLINKEGKLYHKQGYTY
ncbi:MAG: VWA domain-containing protein [Acidobacteria bacterium]|nr:VWA domain-containing protein [Acidobacteriota bacterium]